MRVQEGQIKTQEGPNSHTATKRLMSIIENTEKKQIVQGELKC